ncbi:cold shock domain-containing protein [Bradyrhizobium sp. GM2.2]|uniref:cold-shock protein n=1 Tax=Bradyrhizobium sp. GM2.2 TaxID=3156358 RepID=UPI003397557A
MVKRDPGYGFIKLDDGGADVFVHIGRSRRPAIPSCRGALIRFEIKTGSSGEVSAENLRTG